MAEPGAVVRFGVLGPLLVVDGSGAVRAVPAAKQRIVLVTLLLGGGMMVSAAGLSQALWDEYPPPNAPAVMRTYVTRLRNVLGPVGARIVRRPPGWAIELRGPEELDLTEVDVLWRAARAARDAGEWGRESALLDRALSVWRGEPLADVPSEALARREAGRLAELRLQLTEARIDAGLRLGKHGELIAELRRLASEYPLREHIWAQLMLACYLSGQQAAALEIYREARGMLAGELGVEPGRELQQMHQKILNADRGLTPGAATVMILPASDDRQQDRGAAVLSSARDGDRHAIASARLNQSADGAGPQRWTPPSAPGLTDDGSFAARLNACRRLAGLSQEELAERAGLSSGAVRSMERGRTRWPYPDSVRRLADALELRGEKRAEFIAAARRRLARATGSAVTAGRETGDARVVSAPSARASAYSGLGLDGASSLNGGSVPAVSRALLPIGLHGRQITRRDDRGGGSALAARRGGQGARPAREWLAAFQLPAAPADFTGRAAESRRLTGLLVGRNAGPGVPLVVVSGSPGAGKTSLALHVAHTVRARFGDGQLWVHLAGTSVRPRDPGEVLGEFLRALGAPGSAIPADLAGRTAYYRSWLAGRRVLVVADDAAGVSQVQPLLPGTARCAMVVTSRARLEGLDGAHLLPLDVMTAGDAVGVLAKIVGEDRIAAEPAAADQLVQACGGLPLALRITGAKLATRPSWPLSVMAAKLTGAQDRLGQLESAEASVRASIASSYRSLPERARRGFGLLALLGPVEVAEWALAAMLGEPQAAGVVAELERCSLLTAVGADATGEPRYRLHDLLREFAAERVACEPAADRDIALRRALEGWLQLARLADDRLPPEPFFPRPAAQLRPEIVPAAAAMRLTADPVAWFTAERVNLLAAVERACQAGWLDLAQQLASSQCAFWHGQDRYDDAESHWRLVAESAGRLGDQAVAAHASLRVAASLVRRGQAADALPILDSCIEAGGHDQEPAALALALYWRSICAVDLEDLESARSAAARGVAAARRAGSRAAEYMNLGILGISLAMLGRDDPAAEVGQKALAIATSLGVGAYELEALLSLAFTYNQTGRHQPAVPVCLRAIELSQELGDICGEGLAQGTLADAYHGLGQYKKAAATLHRALPVFRDHSARHFQAICLLKLGYAYQAIGSAQAADYLKQSLRIFRELRLPGKADRAQQALNHIVNTGSQAR
jgi:DNA-binding SARP family transcriptional activator/tetratricopeptide (TPR) repeat protein/transcriptional regulator with XRE-family HTH domain